VSASGTGPLSYAWSGTGLFDPSALSQDVSVTNAATGDYQVTVTNACGSVSSTVSVVVTPAPSATITYEDSPYCNTGGNANVTRIGTAGGTYSALPAGATIDAGSGTIDLDVSEVGVYTVSYTIAANGGCASFTTTTDVTIQAATVWYADVDGDGVGSDDGSVIACEQPTGYVAINGDDCPNDPDKLSPGICGCGIPDTDTDSDGTADCIDGCPTDPDKIAPGACGCGVPDTDSDGDGIADCIDSCPSLPGQIGDACDDNDPGTEDDVITADCVCVGTIIYDCPDLMANIGDACDDGDPNTTNDMITADCECLGTVVYDCPVLMANIGDACDDGDPNTTNDVVTADCECLGTVVYDCPVLMANIGDACDDGDPNTTNDMVTADCECVGTVVYDCPVLMANIGDACDDGDPNTTNDVVTADCECLGTVVYDCPDLMANIGDACDDGDTLTVDDMITEDCICLGDIPDGINDPEGASGVSIALFPNPNRTGLVTLHIEGLAKDASAVLIEVHDAAGRRVYQGTALALGGILDHRMDLSNQVSQGLYMVKAIAGDQRYLQRLVIQ
jgi:hypothetical protein